MSLETRLNSLVTAIGTDIKNLRDTRGNLASLTTTNKANLVAALNELKGLIDSVSPNNIIDDTDFGNLTDEEVKSLNEMLGKISKIFDEEESSESEH